MGGATPYVTSSHARAAVGGIGVVAATSVAVGAAVWRLTELVPLVVVSAVAAPAVRLMAVSAPPR